MSMIVSSVIKREDFLKVQIQGFVGPTWHKTHEKPKYSNAETGGSSPPQTPQLFLLRHTINWRKLTKIVKSKELMALKFSVTADKYRSFNQKQMGNVYRATWIRCSFRIFRKMSECSSWTDDLANTSSDSFDSSYELTEITFESSMKNVSSHPIW